MAHDFKKNPELTNRQLQEMPFDSPHEQITADFRATVVKVHDGDTITLQTSFRDFNFPLRLLDIDAPELSEGGDETRDWLRKQVEGQDVTILIDSRRRVDKYGRLLGRLIYQGLDIGLQELYLGLAKPFERRFEGQLPNLNKDWDLSKWF